MAATLIEVSTPKAGERAVALRGRWTLAALAARTVTLTRELSGHDDDVAWDCRGVEALDSAGAMLLWCAWGRRLPTRLTATPAQMQIFARVAAAEREPRTASPRRSSFEWIVDLGAKVLELGRHGTDFVALLGTLALSVVHVGRHPGDLPLREFSANLYKSGVRAMPVTALVGFLIGVVLSYLSAFQLKQFGADMFIVNILGLGLVRELGPVLVAVLVAGRSGSAMTAQLGVMRVTEEIDALATLGVSRGLRLVLPKVMALTMATPLLVLWTTALALFGGMVAAQAQLDIGYGFFIETLPKVVPVANLWIGFAKGAAFGFSIALIACHFGLRARPNTESLSASTTASVVVAITAVILIDAVFAILTREIGLPR